MEYGLPPVIPYSSPQLSGYFDAFVEHTYNMHNASVWAPTLNYLRGQKEYLENLLSKTVTTLNALRDRQTRNERVLDANPSPRSKKKKILQNKWRTGKTIHTCENEEKVILECLQVCKNNITTLEAIVRPRYCSAGRGQSSVESNPYAHTDTHRFNWKNWEDKIPLSPFHRNRERELPVEEVAPEVSADDAFFYDDNAANIKHTFLLRPRTASTVMPMVPPNTAYPHSIHTMLSPQAAVFEPSILHVPHANGEIPRALDKLSIAGLLSSKRMQLITERRFSDDAIGRLFDRLSPHGRPELAQGRECRTWGSSSASPEKQGQQTSFRATIERTKSY